MTLPRKSQSPKIFDRIAGRYDLLNSILSFGMDASWRKRIVSYLPLENDLRVLDIASGTARVAIALVRNSSRVVSVVGIDLSEKMLKLGRIKVEQTGVSSKVTLQVADAEKLSFANSSFHAVTVGFGVRNMPRLMVALAESYRVLKTGGRLIILETSRPDLPVIRQVHAFYLYILMPLIGLLFSGDLQAYQYLCKTGMAFPYGERFLKIIRQVGFKNAFRKELCLGAVTIYVAEK